MSGPPGHSPAQKERLCPGAGAHGTYVRMHPAPHLTRYSWRISAGEFHAGPYQYSDSPTAYRPNLRYPDTAHTAASELFRRDLSHYHRLGGLVAASVCDDPDLTRERNPAKC